VIAQFNHCSVLRAFVRTFNPLPWGVFPYMGYNGRGGPKGYGFSAVLVLILADFSHFGHK